MDAPHESPPPPSASAAPLTRGTLLRLCLLLPLLVPVLVLLAALLGLVPLHGLLVLLLLGSLVFAGVPYVIVALGFAAATSHAPPQVLLRRARWLPLVFAAVVALGRPFMTRPLDAFAVTAIDLQLAAVAALLGYAYLLLARGLDAAARALGLARDAGEGGP